MPMAVSSRNYGRRIARHAESCGNVRTSKTRTVTSCASRAAAGGFHYEGEANLPDEAGYHFADERFVVGEYVSINERGKMHTYRVTTVSHL